MGQEASSEIYGGEMYINSIVDDGLTRRTSRALSALFQSDKPLFLNLNYSGPAVSNKVAQHFLEVIRQSIVGRTRYVYSAFGAKKMTYCDYASAAPFLKFVEDFIAVNVMQYQSMPKVLGVGASAQTQFFIRQAKELIREGTNASSKDVVVFTGTNGSSALNHLIEVLGLRKPKIWNPKTALSDYSDKNPVSASKRPVVFIGPFENHALELAWRETICDVIRIREVEDSGSIDLKALSAALEEYKSRPLKMGCFTVASAVTGRVMDVPSISILLHSFGAFAFWDFSLAGGYVPISMQSLPDDRIPNGNLAYLDAIFLDPNLMLGGPGSPGVLVAKAILFTNKSPIQPSNGSTSWMTANSHTYKKGVEQREEGSQQSVLGAVRAGLAFHIKAELTNRAIREASQYVLSTALSAWTSNPNIRILGDVDFRNRLPIISLVIKHNDRYLHHNFVAALLHDLFGIQVHAGNCFSQPYGEYLLSIDPDLSDLMKEQVVNQGYEGLRPGWIRITMGHFISKSEMSFIIKAVNMIADLGWRLLPWYNFNPKTGSWTYLQHSASYVSLRALFQNRLIEGDVVDEDETFISHLSKAIDVLERAQNPPDNPPEFIIPVDFRRLLWFPTHSDGFKDVEAERRGDRPRASSAMGYFSLKLDEVAPELGKAGSGSRRTAAKPPKPENMATPGSSMTSVPSQISIDEGAVVSIGSKGRSSVTATTLPSLPESLLGEYAASGPSSTSGLAGDDVELNASNVVRFSSSSSNTRPATAARDSLVLTSSQALASVQDSLSRATGSKVRPVSEQFINIRILGVIPNRDPCPKYLYSPPEDLTAYNSGPKQSFNYEAYLSNQSAKLASTKAPPPKSMPAFSGSIVGAVSAPVRNPSPYKQSRDKTAKKSPAKPSSRKNKKK